MRLVLLGGADDARGFRLAGVESAICRSRADVDDAVAALLEDRTRPPAVVMVSASVHRLAADAVVALQDRLHWPIVVVLPESGRE